MPQSTPFSSAQRESRQTSHAVTTKSEEIENLRRQNEKLARSEARMRAIIEGIAEGVAVAGKNGRLELFNRAADQIMGIGLVASDANDWSSVYGLYLPDGESPCPTHQLPLVRAINGEHVEGVSLVVRHPALESPMQLSVTASPFYDENGDIDGGVAIFQDVTERLRADRLLKEARDQLEMRVKELKASEEKYQDLYENAPDMYATLDPLTLAIVECNQTLASTTGFGKHEIVGCSVLSLHDDPCIGEIADAFESFRQSGVFAGGEYALKCRDGQRIDVNLKVAAVLDQKGDVVQARCVWRDITKWKRAEESLTVHREKLAHLTRVHTAGEMATGLAHELNQPLSAISNYARGFARRAKPGTNVTPELHVAANEMIREADRAASIIEGLRRLVAKRSPDQAKTDLNEVLEDAVFLCRGEARRHGVLIERHPTDGLPLVIADEVQIKQVVICLILNAIEALRDESVQAPRVLVGTKRDSDDQIVIEVQDNGTGIAPEAVDRIFEAFYTTKAEGLGMGLAICRSIVENHRGRIWNRASPLGGASFCVSLPSKQGKA